jgi:starch synthase
VVLTIHNLSHQGQTAAWWLQELGPRAWAYDGGDHTNVLAGGIRLADRVVSVSRTYAAEIVHPEHGNGLHDLLASKGYDLVGIRNGIDTTRWDPAVDDYLPANFAVSDLSGKEVCNKELRRIAGFVSSRGPIVGMVARMVHQKGVDLALELAPYLENMPAHLILLGTGEPHYLELAERTAAQYPGRVWIAERYDDELAHLLVAGSDLLLVPSRFEPCGLTQMEAMAYGTIPVVTDVGGLHDTVVDCDADPRHGTGFVAPYPDTLPLLDALHRAVRGWNNGRRRLAMQQRAMSHDWSWRQPALAHLELYDELAR